MRFGTAGQSSQTQPHLTRERILAGAVSVWLLLVVGRLFYWQVLQRDRLQAFASNQYSRTLSSTGTRGKIYTADGSLLVGNEEVYRLFAEPQLLDRSPQELSGLLTDLIVADPTRQEQASTAAELKELEASTAAQLRDRLDSDGKWVGLASNLSAETKQKILDLKLKGLGFDTEYRRAYPEASMAAHLTGFVGKDEEGFDVGYFGVEGGLEQELKARSDTFTVLSDALGLPLTSEKQRERPVLDGRDVTLTIRRDMQHAVERQLQKGVEKYGAAEGEVIVLDPKTGNILAVAATPGFEQRRFYKYPQENFSNPALTHVYEPGSTLKVLTVASGIDGGVIEPDTACDSCSGPRQFGKYTIRTWNNEYEPGISMTRALAHSDNTAMIVIAEKLGAEKLREYLEKFKIGQAVNLELQGDRDTPFPQKWGPVELATISFGQGISTTTLQLIRAISAVANKGTMMQPRIVQSVSDPLTGKVFEPEPQVAGQPISAETAEKVTGMMIESAAHGEAQWTASKLYSVAGKTGTSQVAENGVYLADKTIASFIGFAPAPDPQFVMVVKLIGPQSSPWAAETAAPLWYSIAQDLFLLLNIPPDLRAAEQAAPVTIPVGD